MSEQFTIVQIVAIDETGDTCYRMRWPGMQLAEQNPNWRVINIASDTGDVLEYAENADLLVVYQSNDIELLPIISRRKQKGLKTLTEYNDNFYQPPPESPVAKAWGSPVLWQVYESFMEVSDQVLVTGPGLEQLFSDISDTEISVLENHLHDEPPELDKVFKQPTDNIYVGWAGSLGHMSDVLALKETFLNLIEADERVKICLMGNKALPDVMGIPLEKLVFIPWGTMEEYYGFLESLHIGIAPLIDTPYNRCRSDVKAIEMSSRGVLPVLCDLLPYQEFFSATGVKGFKTFAELEKQILSYVADTDKLSADVSSCYQYAVDQRLGKNRTERSELYNSMLPAKPNDFDWKCEPGFHEIASSMENVRTPDDTLQRIQSLHDQGSDAKALEIIKDAIYNNPWNSDYQLAAIRLQSKSDVNAALADANKAVEKFPLDLRLKLVRITLYKTLNEVKEGWQEVVAQLKEGDSSFQSYFYITVAEMFARYLRSHQQLAMLGVELLKIYPHSAQLTMEVAICLERAGDYENAQKFYQKLVLQKEAMDLNQKFLGNVQKSFLLSWDNALEARLNKSF